MIVAYAHDRSGIHPISVSAKNLINENVVWIDLISPTHEEEKMVEKQLKINIPTKEEMQEIEPSSRLYKENNILYMTVTMIAKSDSPRPKSDAVTFILTETKLLTVRYIEPSSFAMFTARLSRLDAREFSAENLLIGLLESTTDRLADILENIGNNIDGISYVIFHTKNNNNHNHTHNHQSEVVDNKKLLQDIGANSDLATKIRESLVSFSRFVSFFGRSCKPKLDPESHSRLEIVTEDINALSDHANFISNKFNFLLDATLGMVNIEQNNIIKVFSVAAVIFLPPTLIASIYGMNFQIIPELNWHFGYPLAILLMIASAWVPYRYFKMRKWL